MHCSWKFQSKKNHWKFPATVHKSLLDRITLKFPFNFQSQDWSFSRCNMITITGKDSLQEHWWRILHFHSCTLSSFFFVFAFLTSLLCLHLFCYTSLIKMLSLVFAVSSTPYYSHVNHILSFKLTSRDADPSSFLCSTKGFGKQHNFWKQKTWVAILIRVNKSSYSDSMQFVADPKFFL